MIAALRTPDERFADLPGYGFKPRYEPIDGLRMHYLDEGPRDARTTFLCLHGQPSWSYLYRRMIPVFAAAGHRVVAPDLFGFGRSDKPVDEAAYTFSFHRQSLVTLIDHLDLSGLVLVCQDWGGLLGLTLPPDMPRRFTRLLVMNTMLATGDEPLPRAFLDWRAFGNSRPDMAIGALLKRGCPHLGDAEAAAYDAPFPDAHYKAGVRRFPQLVPIASEAADEEVMALGRAARDWWATKFSGQSFMGVGLADPVLGKPVMDRMRESIRGCPPPMELEGVGHFVQEQGAPLARAALKHWGDL
jgi:haloalkane dehalogenase